MAKKKIVFLKIVRVSAKILLWIALSFAALYLTVNLFINTPVAVSIVNKKVDGVHIGKLRGFLPFSLSVYDITYKKDGIDAHIPSVSIRLNPFALITKTVSVRDFSIASPNVIVDTTFVPQKPIEKDAKEAVAESNKEPVEEKKPFHLPVNIHIKRARIIDLQRCEIITAQGRYALEGLSLEMSAHVTKAAIDGNTMSCRITAPNGVVEVPDRGRIPFVFDTMLSYSPDTAFDHSLSVSFKDALKKMRSFSIKYTINGNVHKELVDLQSLTVDLNEKRAIDISATVAHFSDLKKIALSVRRLALDVDIADAVGIVKANFMPTLPLEASGKITFAADGSPDVYKGALLLSDGAFTFDSIRANNIGITIGIDGKNKNYAVDVNAKVASLHEKKSGQTVNDFKLDLRVAVANGIQVQRIVLNDCSLMMYGGTLALKGSSNFMNNIDYSLTLRDFTYLKYFNMPLTAKITADLHAKGETPKSVVVDTAIRVTDIDYRKDAMAVKVPRCELSGTAIIDVDKEFAYVDQMRLNVGDKSSVFLNGYVEKWGNERINLDMKDSAVDIAEIRQFVGMLQQYDMAGRVELTAEIRGTAKEPLVTGDVKFIDVVYGDPKTKLTTKGITGKVWYTFTMPKTSVVAEVGCESVRMPGIEVDGLSVSMPYTFAPKEKGTGKLTQKYNFFLQRAAFNQYEWTDISASIAAYNKHVALSGLLIHFLDGQIGGDMTIDLDTMTYSVALSGIDINLRKAARKSGTSIFAFASKIQGTKTDLSGYFDITRIDKDVLDKLLISLDPDKKNPEIQGIRSKLNMVGVVPKNIRVRVENGYVDIIPEFTTRRSNLISIVLGFFVGNVEVDPIRRIPLKAILKELNLEG